MKDAAEAKQYGRGLAPEGDGRKGCETTGGSLNSIQEKSENSTREAEATTSTGRSEIVRKVRSVVRDLDNAAALCRTAEARKIFRKKKS